MEEYAYILLLLYYTMYAHFLSAYVYEYYMVIMEISNVV